MTVSKTDLFLMMIRTLRHTLAAAVTEIDVILTMADQPADTAPRTRGECPHPVAGRINKAAMGHPNRFFCTTCDQDVEG